ncbi:hypothetical protein evm_013816 [Chilo suppressalis]|nr:hypothetical protein evm_013816 [Chilo suppressalis]
MLNILQSWITPTQLSSESIICTECLEILQNRANVMNDENILPLPAFGHGRVCFPCGNSILRAPITYPVNQDREERHVLNRLVPLHLISRMERVCAACWRAATRQVQRQQQHGSNRPILGDSTLSSNPFIPVPPPLPPPRPEAVQQVTTKVVSSLYSRVANTPGHCVFVNFLEPERLLIPSTMKDLLLYNNKLYIPSGRVCRHHLNYGSWNELTSQLRDFTGTQFDNIMIMMQRAANYKIDFSNVLTMPPPLCHYWLGMNSDQFNNLLNCIPNLADHVPNASIALCFYLVKLRTADSNERLTTLFNKPRATLERWMRKARNCLVYDFVLFHLGFNHMTTQDLSSRNRIIPEELFSNPDLPASVKPTIVICDATYVFVQSSSNYLYQKETYSLQKMDNLVKPFLIVCCDGHIVECLGPYKATTNDARITSLNLNNEESGFASFFRRDDPPEALEYVAIAKNRLLLENHLAIYVEREHLNRRRVKFQAIDSEHPHLATFPRLTISDLKRLALGTYQLKQARSYFGEHVRQSGTYLVEVNNEIEDDIPLVFGVNNYLLRGRIKSRHVSSRTYYTYLLISRDAALAETLDAIKGHYCSCLVGWLNHGLLCPHNDCSLVFKLGSLQ